jgi:hypothetical protein
MRATRGCRSSTISLNSIFFYFVLLHAYRSAHKQLGVQEDDKFEIKADIPGVDKGNIKVSFY